MKKLGKTISNIYFYTSILITVLLFLIGDGTEKFIYTLFGFFVFVVPGLMAKYPNIRKHVPLFKEGKFIKSLLGYCISFFIWFIILVFYLSTPSLHNNDITDENSTGIFHENLIEKTEKTLEEIER